MEEYEYSFKVSRIDPYIKYCIENKYKKIDVKKEKRIVYENKFNKKLIARLTRREDNEVIFDIKNKEKSKDVLNISKESLPIKVTKDNKDFIDSIINVMGFYQVANNIRTRYIYELNNVKFEIDDYELPKMGVIAIEGTRKNVDKVYNDIKSKIKEVN